MLSVAEGGIVRMRACIRKRGCLASVIWGDLVKVFYAAKMTVNRIKFCCSTFDTLGVVTFLPTGMIIVMCAAPACRVAAHL